MADGEVAFEVRAMGVRVAERPARLTILRIWKSDQEIERSLGEALGLSWPSAPNTVAAGASCRIAWLAPGEWAILDGAEDLAERIAAACERRAHHLAEVSAGRRWWRIEGPRGRALIAKGCSLDTHPRLFPPGRCAQTRLADIPVLLIPCEEGAFEILADASFAGHLRAWLADAAIEYRR